MSATFQMLIESAKSDLSENHLDSETLDQIAEFYRSDIKAVKESAEVKIEQFGDQLNDYYNTVKDAIDFEALKLLESEFWSLRQEIEKGEKSESYLIGFSLGVMKELFREIDIDNMQEEVELP
jgi:hypothetical protein